MKLHLSRIFLLFGILLVSSTALFARQNPSMEILTKEIRQGYNFEVKANGNASLDSKAWIGIFKLDAGTNYETYEYIGNEEGKVITLKAPIIAGNYELRFHDTDPGKVIKKMKFSVISTQPHEYDLTIVTQEINPSSSFQVHIKTNFDIDKDAWIGIFKEELPKDKLTYESYKYIGNKRENTISLTAPSKPGDYALRYYSSDPGGLIATLPFRVGSPDLPGIGFNTDKKVYKAAEEITVTYTGHEKLQETAWIGMYKVDAKEDTYSRYLEYFYLNPKLKGSLTFKAPTTKGKYKFRMFYAETGPQVLEAVHFEVSNSLDENYLKKTLDTKGKVTLYGIYFDTNKSIIKPESFALIEEIAKMLNADTSVKIQIEGHTDTQGDNGYNQMLSEKRAAAVANLLIEKYNVSKNQLQHKGFGETKPIGDNKTASGRAKNRRVELKKID
ncbi:OmpA family protein [uncultured Kordia sp.]|uniref:OmpA family protein n=1 Tax=uncultured Kordia sp. TaxID=507699 RepID=UPI002634FB8E|nr:OmpA family protein [uncultured Kordia sp.]